MLKLLGTRVDALDLRAFIRRLRGRPAPYVETVEESFWYRFANAVMRHALPVAVFVTAVLVAFGLPFLRATFGYPDYNVVPKSQAVHQVGSDLRTGFTTNAASTITVVAPDTSAAATQVAEYSAALSQVHGINSVTSATGTYVGGTRVAPGDATMISGHATYLNLQTGADAQSGQAKTVLSDLRRVHAPWPVQFTGQTAINQDSLHALAVTMPIALILIVLATFIVLFLFTGSLVLPIKALVLNTLSLSATFGAMVWVFQEGHLGWLFPDLTTTGYLVPTMPPLMFCVAFGLSMDYEVFLLSRIREAWLRSPQTTEDNTRAVAVGLGPHRPDRHRRRAADGDRVRRHGNAHVSFMMLFGVGLTLAVVMDATIVRGIMVPAFMKLAGRWNWYAPKPLVRLHAKIGLSEDGPEQAASDRELVGSNA